MDIQLTRQQKRGPYVEFNCSGDEHGYQQWADKSLFLHETIFGIFAAYFEFDGVRLNYYGPTLYADSTLIRLKVRLEDAQSDLQHITDCESMVPFIRRSAISENFFCELQQDGVDIATSWPRILQGFKDICMGLLELIHEALRDHRVLWVLGI